MVSRTRKRLSPTERRVRILAAASQLFAERGYDDAAMEAIAATAGITKPVLYDHFASKQALFLAVLSSLRDALLDQGRALAQSDSSSEEALREALGAFFLFVEQQPGAARLLFSIPRGDQIAAEAAREVQAGATASIARILGARFRDRMIGNEAAAEFLKAGLHGLAQWWLEHPDLDRDELVETVMAIAWAGLGGRR